MAPPARVRLSLLGPHTRVVADLCASCPAGPLGCCSQPPDLSWADIGRVASLGGARFLADEISAGRLTASPHGLSVKRIPAGPTGETKCVYHGAEGCEVPPEQRSAACNYYVCRDALETAGEEAFSVEAASLSWTSAYHGWNEILSIDAAARAAGDETGTSFFDELGSRFAELSARR